MARKNSRREHGTGSIFKRKDGRWVAQLFLGYGENGKARYKIAYRPSQAEAVKALNLLQADLTSGKVLPTQRQSVEKFLTSWLESSIEGHKAPKTVDYYRLMVGRHLVPTIGRTDVRKLDASQVQALLNEKSKSGLSPSTVRGIRAVLRAALNQAWRWGMVAENVALKVEGPKIVKPDPVYLEPEQAQRLCEAAIGHPAENLIKLALGTGLRIGEATGLRWQDVDFPTATLRVQVQLQRIGGKLTLKPLKSASSRRNLPLLGLALEAAQAETTRQLLLKTALGEEGFNPLGLVFLNAEGRPFDQKHVDKCLKALCCKAGIQEVSFHKLRHTAATLMVAAGVPLALVKDQLGHSSIALTTGTYAHMVPAAQRQAAEALDRALRGLHLGSTE